MIKRRVHTLEWFQKNAKLYEDGFSYDGCAGVFYTCLFPFAGYEIYREYITVTEYDGSTREYPILEWMLDDDKNEMDDVYEFCTNNGIATGTLLYEIISGFNEFLKNKNNDK